MWRRRKKRMTKWPNWRSLLSGDGGCREVLNEEPGDGDWMRWNHCLVAAAAKSKGWIGIPRNEWERRRKGALSEGERARGKMKTSRRRTSRKLVRNSKKFGLWALFESGEVSENELLDESM